MSTQRPDQSHDLVPDRAPRDIVAAAVQDALDVLDARLHGAQGDGTGRATPETIGMFYRIAQALVEGAKDYGGRSAEGVHYQMPHATAEAQSRPLAPLQRAGQPRPGQQRSGTMEPIESAMEESFAAMSHRVALEMLPGTRIPLTFGHEILGGQTEQVARFYADFEHPDRGGRLIFEDEENDQRHPAVDRWFNHPSPITDMVTAAPDIALAPVNPQRRQVSVEEFQRDMAALGYHLDFRDQKKSFTVGTAKTANVIGRGGYVVNGPGLAMYEPANRAANAAFFKYRMNTKVVDHRGGTIHYALGATADLEQADFTARTEAVLADPKDADGIALDIEAAAKRAGATPTRMKSPKGVVRHEIRLAKGWKKALAGLAEVDGALSEMSGDNKQMRDRLSGFIASLGRSAEAPAPGKRPRAARDIQAGLAMAVDLGHMKGEIFELALVEMRNGVRVGTAEQMRYRIPPELAAKLKRIDGGTLEVEPTFPDRAVNLRDRIGTTPLIGYAVHNDLAKLNRAFVRAGLPPIPKAQTIDIMEIAKQLEGPSDKKGHFELARVARRFGIELDFNAHNSIEDANLAAKLAEHPKFAPYVREQIKSIEAAQKDLSQFSLGQEPTEHHMTQENPFVATSLAAHPRRLQRDANMVIAGQHGLGPGGEPEKEWEVLTRLLPPNGKQVDGKQVDGEQVDKHAYIYAGPWPTASVDKDPRERIWHYKVWCEPAGGGDASLVRNESDLTLRDAMALLGDDLCVDPEIERAMRETAGQREEAMARSEALADNLAATTALRIASGFGDEVTLENNIFRAETWGMRVWETGGNCRAFERDAGGDCHVLVTAEADITANPDSSVWTAGLYRSGAEDGSEPIAQMGNLSLGLALSHAQSFVEHRAHHVAAAGVARIIDHAGLRPAFLGYPSRHEISLMRYGQPLGPMVQIADDSVSLIDRPSGDGSDMRVLQHWDNSSPDTIAHAVTALGHEIATRAHDLRIDVAPLMTALAELGREAVPQHERDDGAARQVAALNRFVERLRSVMSPGDFSDFERWCLKATPSEMVNEGLARVASAHGVSAPQFSLTGTERGTKMEPDKERRATDHRVLDAAAAFLSPALNAAVIAGGAAAVTMASGNGEKVLEAARAAAGALGLHYAMPPERGTEIDWSDSEERLALLERVGPDAYNQAWEANRRKSIAGQENGYDIHPVSSRFGQLFAVDGTGEAFGSLQEARTFAAKQPPKSPTPSPSTGDPSYAIADPDSSEGAPAPSARDLADAYEASAKGEAILRQAVSQGLNVNQADDQGLTALHWAAGFGKHEQVRLLIAEGADVNARYGADRITALHAAARGGVTSIVEMLVAAGADVNATTRFGDTPLMAATALGGVEPVKALLQAGATIDAVNQGGWTALMEGAASDRANVAVIDALLDAGAQINHAGRQGLTALMVASGADRGKHGHTNLAVIAALIQRGADLHAQDEEGLTALDHARARGLSAVAQLLSDSVETKQGAMAKQEAEARHFSLGELPEKSWAPPMGPQFSLQQAEEKPWFVVLGLDFTAQPDSDLARAQVASMLVAIEDAAGTRPAAKLAIDPNSNGASGLLGAPNTVGMVRLELALGFLNQQQAQAAADAARRAEGVFATHVIEGFPANFDQALMLNFLHSAPDHAFGTQHALPSDPEPTPKVSARIPVPADFPDVVTQSEAASLKKHPLFEAAKTGDIVAADQIVREHLSAESVRAVGLLAENHEGAVLVPVIKTSAIEGRNMVGANALPLAYAKLLGARLNLPVDLTVVQLPAEKRFGLSNEHRLGSSPVFNGAVQSGTPTIIVDDNVTLGATALSLRAHLEANGAKVIGITSLTAGHESRTLQVDPALAGRLQQALGAEGVRELDKAWKEKFGYGIDCLSAAELRTLSRIAEQTRGEPGISRAAGIARRLFETEGERDGTRNGSADRRESPETGLNSESDEPRTHGVRVLVTGGREFNDASAVDAALAVTRSLNLDALIEGGARGADTLCGDWARTRGIPVETFEARWTQEGRAAGALRNLRMLREGTPDLLIAFPGGRGTAHMVEAASKAGLPVFDAGDLAAGRVQWPSFIQDISRHAAGRASEHATTSTQPSFSLGDPTRPDADASFEPAFVVVSEYPDKGIAGPTDPAIIGTYRVEVRSDLPDELKCEVALDHFHENNGIDYLDAYVIRVVDAQGRVLPPMENHENGSTAALGRYIGKLDALDLSAESEISAWAQSHRSGDAVAAAIFATARETGMDAEQIFEMPTDMDIASVVGYLRDRGVTGKQAWGISILDVDAGTVDDGPVSASQVTFGQLALPQDGHAGQRAKPGEIVKADLYEVLIPAPGLSTIFDALGAVLKANKGQDLGMRQDGMLRTGFAEHAQAEAFVAQARRLGALHQTVPDDPQAQFSLGDIRPGGPHPTPKGPRPTVDWVIAGRETPDAKIPFLWNVYPGQGAAEAALNDPAMAAAWTQRYPGGVQAMSLSDYYAMKRDVLLDGVIAQTTQTAYEQALGCLPPEDWQRRPDGIERFHLSEYLSGTFTREYVAKDGEYFTTIVDAKDPETWATAAKIESAKTEGRIQMHYALPEALDHPLPERVARIRESVGWSAVKLAERAKVQPVFIQDIEAGRLNRVSPDIISKVTSTLSYATGVQFSLAERDGAVTYLAPDEGMPGERAAMIQAGTRGQILSDAGDMVAVRLEMPASGLSTRLYDLRALSGEGIGEGDVHAARAALAQIVGPLTAIAAEADMAHYGFEPTLQTRPGSNAPALYILQSKPDGRWAIATGAETMQQAEAKAAALRANPDFAHDPSFSLPPEPNPQFSLGPWRAAAMGLGALAATSASAPPAHAGHNTGGVLAGVLVGAVVGAAATSHASGASATNSWQPNPGYTASYPQAYSQNGYDAHPTYQPQATYQQPACPSFPQPQREPADGVSVVARIQSRSGLSGLKPMDQLTIREAANTRERDLRDGRIAFDYGSWEEATRGLERLRATGLAGTPGITESSRVAYALGAPDLGTKISFISVGRTGEGKTETRQLDPALLIRPGATGHKKSTEEVNPKGQARPDQKSRAPKPQPLARPQDWDVGGRGPLRLLTDVDPQGRAKVRVELMALAPNALIDRAQVTDAGIRQALNAAKPLTRGTPEAQGLLRLIREMRDARRMVDEVARAREISIPAAQKPQAEAPKQIRGTKRGAERD